MQIIAFGHRRGVGKDLACSIIKEQFKDLKIRQYSFASVLKEHAAILFGDLGLYSGEVYEKNPEMKEVVLRKIDKSPRDIWIEYGNFMRQIYEDVWVNKVLNQLDPTLDVALISDMRYHNEAAEIKLLEGKLIRIDRPSIPKFSDVADSNLAHFKQWDAVIVNDSDFTFHDRVIETVLPYIRKTNATISTS